MSENLPIDDEPEAVNDADVEGHAARANRMYEAGRDDQAAPPLVGPDDDDVDGHGIRSGH